MTLLFYRIYTGQTFIGLVVGLDDSNVSRRIPRVEPLLQRVFRVPTRKIKLTEDEIWELIVDATEQEARRRRKTKYSGKKHQQTIKTQIHINQQGPIKAVSKDITGNRHDKHLYDQSKVYCRGPDGSAVRAKTKGDLWYDGTDCNIPIKKPKSKDTRKIF